MQENAEVSAVEDSTGTVVERVRYCARANVHKQREAVKAKAADALRMGLGEIQTQMSALQPFTMKDVQSIIGRLKRRKHATEEDMYRLSVAFLQDMQNIEAFAHTPGAMAIVVKELSGNDAERTEAALECLCNMTLGGNDVCDAIALKAGGYLVTFLHSLDVRLKQTCLQTLANLLHSSERAANLLLKMQLLPLLWQIYVHDEGEGADNCCEDAAVCLQLLAVDRNAFKQDELMAFVRENMHLKDPAAKASEYQLQIIFHTNLMGTIEQYSQFEYLLNFVIYNFLHCANFETQVERLRIIYALRILGNLMGLVDKNDQLTSRLQSQQAFCEQVIHKLYALGERYLHNEILWFLTNYVTFFGAHNRSVQKLLMELKPADLICEIEKDENNMET